MTDPTDLRSLAARAATASTWAPRVAEAGGRSLEAFALRSPASSSPFEYWNAIDDGSDRTEPEVRSFLIEVRRLFEEALLASQRERLEQLVQRSPQAASDDWTASIAEAMAAFRFSYARRVCELSALVPPSETQPPETVLRTIRYMLQQRWSDSFAVLSALARNPAVPKVTRARLLVMAGDIDLYYTKDRDAADRAMKRRRRWRLRTTACWADRLTSASTAATSMGRRCCIPGHCRGPARFWRLHGHG